VITVASLKRFWTESLVTPSAQGQPHVEPR
jgi:hypothetical protein